VLSGDVPVPSRLARLALLAYLAVPLALTLAPSPPGRRLFAFQDLLQPVVSALTLGRATISLDEAEALGNLLLLLPVGLLLPFAAPRLAPALVLAGSAVASLGVETVQRVLLEDRSPSLQDVMLNVGGTAIGLVVALELRRWSQSRGESEPREGDCTGGPHP